MDELSILRARVTMLEQQAERLTKSLLCLWALVKTMLEEVEDEEVEESTSMAE